MEGFIRQLLTLPQVQELTAGINGRERHSVVTGLSPVQRAAVAAAAAEQTGRPLLMLCADEQECARQAADLRALTGQEPVVLPAREWQLRPAAAYSRQWEYRRLWALYRLGQEAPRVMVATAAAMGVLTPMPCVPATVAWAPGCPTVTVCKRPLLNSTSKLTCSYGGVIQVTVTPAMTVKVP